MVSEESPHCTISLLSLSCLQTQDAVKKSDVQKINTRAQSQLQFVRGCIKQVHIILNMQGMYRQTINTDKV
jgi:hypothetical protein